MSHKIITTQDQNQRAKNHPTLKSNKQTGGRLIQGGKVDDFGTRLGWWEPTIFQRDPTDIPLELGPKYNMRPDRLAYDFYGKANLMWFVLQYNYIADVSEFVAGLQIILPTKGRLFQQILAKNS